MFLLAHNFDEARFICITYSPIDRLIIDQGDDLYVLAQKIVRTPGLRSHAYDRPESRNGSHIAEDILLYGNRHTSSRP